MDTGKPATIGNDDVRRGAAGRGARRVRISAGAVRHGFTLIELMVTMMVIAILASIFLGALSEAEDSARVARTQALVDKLNNMVMARWDTYATVRLPISLEAKTVGGATNMLFDSSTDVVKFRQNVARRKMFALRELVRLEMPDRYDDIDIRNFTQVELVRPDPVKPGATVPVRSAIWCAYQRRLTSAKNSRPNGQNMSLGGYIDLAAAMNESAEMLYLIVTTNVDTSAVSTEHISPADWRDTDLDGMPEFIDAWGKPIQFLRWAPGVESSLQPLYRYPTNDDTDKRWRVFHEKQPRDPDDSTKMVSHWNIQIDKVIDNSASNITTSGATRQLIDRTVIISQEDPFNPMRVGSVPDLTQQGSTWTRSTRWRPGDPPPENGYALFPLIYSGGSDQTPGIQECLRRSGWVYDSSPSDGYPLTPDIKFSDPYAVYKDPANNKYYRGAPIGDGTDGDNITNHRIGTN